MRGNRSYNQVKFKERWNITLIKREAKYDNKIKAIMTTLITTRKVEQTRSRSKIIHRIERNHKLYMENSKRIAVPALIYLLKKCKSIFPFQSQLFPNLISQKLITFVWKISFSKCLTEFPRRQMSSMSVE